MQKPMSVTGSHIPQFYPRRFSKLLEGREGGGVHVVTSSLSTWRLLAGCRKTPTAVSQCSHSAIVYTGKQLTSQPFLNKECSTLPSFMNL